MSEIDKIKYSGTDYDIGGSGGGGTGLSDEAKQALLACFEKVAWIDDNGQDYYAALETALYPPVGLLSISCVYTQSGTVYDTFSLDSLRSDLVVTAHYDDSSTGTITTYTLSGTLTVGTSTITVSYGGKTTTFTVVVTSGSVSLAPKYYHVGSDGYPSLSAGDTVMNCSMPSDMVEFTGSSSEGGYWTYWDGTTTGIDGATISLTYSNITPSGTPWKPFFLYAVNADKTKCYGWWNATSGSWSQTTSAEGFYGTVSGIVLPDGYYPLFMCRRFANEEGYDTNQGFSYACYQYMKLNIGMTE